MQFLVDLINWFIHGRIEEASVSPVKTSVVETTREDEPKKQPVNVNVVDQILADGRRKTFLEELKSVEPLGKQFEKDRHDLEQEVKRLAHPRKRP